MRLALENGAEPLAGLPRERETQSAPRNREAFAIGRRRRELIRELMLERALLHPLARPLTSKQMCEQLHRHDVYLSISAVRWHIEAIRDEADLEALTEDAQ